MKFFFLILALPLFSHAEGFDDPDDIQKMETEEIYSFSYRGSEWFDTSCDREVSGKTFAEWRANLQKYKSELSNLNDNTTCEQVPKSENALVCNKGTNKEYYVVAGKGKAGCESIRQEIRQKLQNQLGAKNPLPKNCKMLRGFSVVHKYDDHQYEISVQVGMHSRCKTKNSRFGNCTSFDYVSDYEPAMLTTNKTIFKAEGHVSSMAVLCNGKKSVHLQSGFSKDVQLFTEAESCKPKP